MREILFRGQTRRKGQKVWMDGTPVESNWVYGGVLQGTGDYSIIYGGNDPDDKGTANLDKWPVYTDTMGQFTGLLDKNGKRIFEGDIVETDLARPYLVVVFRDGAFMFNCNDGGEDYYDIMLPICKEEQIVYEYGCVIGNIHDNPELMEVSNE